MREKDKKKKKEQKNGGPEMTNELAGNIHVNTTLGSRYNKEKKNRLHYKS